MRKLGLLLIFLLGCGANPGKISVTLDADALSTTTKGDIKEFIFIVAQQSPSKQLIFPSECLSCSSSTSPCPDNDQCLKSGSCGFSSSDSVFEPEIDFAQINEGKTIAITACAMDTNQNPIAAGEKMGVENTDGKTAKIVMSSSTSSTDSLCVNKLPAVCP